MEHESDSYTHDKHYSGQDDSGGQHNDEFEFTVEETQPEPQQAQQTDPRNQQQQYQSRAPGYAPPSRPAPTMPPRNYPPQSNPQNYPPQPIPQQFPPQRGYYPPGQPVQAPPQQYPPQTYGKSPTTSPYKPPGVDYQNAAPPTYPNAGYAAPTPGYPQQSPYQPYPRTTGTVGWSTGLFDCMDDANNALITACCPCFTFGQIAEIVDSGHTTCATSGILYGCIAAFTLAPCLISCSYRTKMRNQYDLVEVPAADWITHCFCEWCALCQEYRELKNRGIDPAIGWQGNMMRNQQQPQVAMMPPGNQTMQG